MQENEIECDKGKTETQFCMDLEIEPECILKKMNIILLKLAGKNYSSAMLGVEQNDGKDENMMTPMMKVYTICTFLSSVIFPPGMAILKLCVHFCRMEDVLPMQSELSIPIMFRGQMQC